MGGRAAGFRGGGTKHAMGWVGREGGWVGRVGGWVGRAGQGRGGGGTNHACHGVGG